MNTRKFLAYLHVLAALCFWTSRVGADPLDPWVWRNPLPAGNTLTGVAYGNGVIVAVADTGSILTSPNATNWNLQTVDNGMGALTGVVYAQNQFVGVGSANLTTGQSAGVYTSPDGTNWTSHTVPDTFILSAICYGTNEYVAVGIVGFILFSPDGTNWNIAGSDTMTSFNGVAYGTNGFVAVGDDSLVETSPDGANWSGSTLATNVTESVNLLGITFANSEYVAVGENATILTSPDGTHWTNRPNPKSASGLNFDGICYGNGQFVVVGAGIDVSSDGINWTNRTASTPFNLNSVADYTNGYIAVGVQGAIQISTAGEVWHSRSIGGNDLLQSAIYVNNEFVLAGGGVANGEDTVVGYVVDTSIDGVHFNRYAGTSPNFIYGMAYGDNRFVAVGINGYILTSENSITWTQQKSGTQDNLNGVIYTNNLFVAVGQADVHTSLDGITWTSQNPQTQNTLTGVAYGNNEYVAVGYGGAIQTSPDATNWTSQIPAGTYQLNGVAFGAGVFVLVGIFDVIATSSDGVNWENNNSFLRDYIVNFRAVAYGNGLFVAVGDSGVVVTSPDGMNWSGPIFTTDQNFYGVTAGNGGFLAVTDGGAVMQSDESVVPPMLGPIILQAGGASQVTVSAVAGQAYLIQASSDLMSWVTITNVTLNNKTGQFIDFSSTNYPQRFYRAVGQ